VVSRSHSFVFENKTRNPNGKLGEVKEELEEGTYDLNKKNSKFLLADLVIDEE